MLYWKNICNKTLGWYTEYRIIIAENAGKKKLVMYPLMSFLSTEYFKKLSQASIITKKSGSDFVESF
jgi:hypothetical protein